MQDLTNLFAPLRQVKYSGEPKVGAHVNWNAPTGKTQPAWETLLGILSACYWTSLYGPIDLYTDKLGAEKVKKLGLEGLYRNVKLLDEDLAAGFDPSIFWAAGKFLAMLEADEPTYFIDQDLLVTKELDFGNIDVLYFHREYLNEKWYPLGVAKAIQEYYGTVYADALAYNCAFVHFKEVSTARQYAAESLRFINQHGANFKYYNPREVMASVEQFGLNQFCVAHELSSDCLIKAIYTGSEKADTWMPDPDGVYDIDEAGGYIYHVWAEKEHYRNDWTASVDFSMRIVNLLEDKLKTSMEPLLSKLNFHENK